jgi:hypothetical protein
VCEAGSVRTIRARFVVQKNALVFLPSVALFKATPSITSLKPNRPVFLSRRRVRYITAGYVSRHNSVDAPHG